MMDGPIEDVKDEKVIKKSKFSDIFLEFVYKGFKASPLHLENQDMEHLPEFLVEHGALVTKLSYTDKGYLIRDKEHENDEKYRQLIIKHCPNISDVQFHFTEYPDSVDDDNSQLLIKFLTALAPGLTRLETINNLIGLHYLSCMGYVYENFSSKIKFVKTDELKPEELSVLGGDNNKDNPALSLEELIFDDNLFLYCKKRVHQSPESLALKPASLADLVKLKNLRRIDLPFLPNKDKVPSVTPLPLLTYASIRLLKARGKPSLSPFVKNIGIALSNVVELKLSDWDPGYMVLCTILKSCTKLEKLDLTTLHVPDDYNLDLSVLNATKLNFKQLDAEIGYRSPQKLELFLYFFKNVKSLTNINISDIHEDTVDQLIAASISLAEAVQHEIFVNLKYAYRATMKTELPTSKPDNLKIKIALYDD